MEKASRSIGPRVSGAKSLSPPQSTARSKVLPMPVVAKEREPSVQAAERLRLLARIKRAIGRKTSSGVRELVVAMQGDAVHLSGHCASFYCKQLAQHTAMYYLADVPLVNAIEVAPPR